MHNTGGTVMNNIDRNQVAVREQAKKTELGITKYLNLEPIKNNVIQALGSEQRAMSFTSSIISAVQANAQLAECEKASILNAALLGEALNLSPSASLGHYFMVPFSQKGKPQKQATFQLGYKGYVQLAIRSGNYQKLNVLEIKDGEFKRWDPLNEELEVDLIEDEGQRAATETIGYYGYFVLNNGFKKAIYWTKKHMEAHAKEYSKSYNSGNSFWNKNFDEMAKKTILRQLLSKWGIMSVDMQTAYRNDMAVVNDSGNPEYVDNPYNDPDPLDVAATEVVAATD